MAKLQINTSSRLYRLLGDKPEPGVEPTSPCSLMLRGFVYTVIFGLGAFFFTAVFLFATIFVGSVILNDYSPLSEQITLREHVPFLVAGFSGWLAIGGTLYALNALCKNITIVNDAVEDDPAT